MPFNENLIADAHAFLEAHAAATEGSWKVEPGRRGATFPDVLTESGEIAIAEELAHTDATFIVAAHNISPLLIEGLLARVEELEKRLKTIANTAVEQDGKFGWEIAEEIVPLAKAALSEKQ